MKLGERTRWWLALAGPVQLEISSFMPLLGRAAKHRHRCDSREFTGSFDDCFNDYLPIVELALPVLALILIYPFARVAFSLFAPEPSQLDRPWRFAKPDLWHPGLQIAAAIGCGWAIWRAFSYPLAIELWPYIAFWLVFAIWFALGAIAGGLRETVAP